MCLEPHMNTHILTDAQMQMTPHMHPHSSPLIPHKAKHCADLTRIYTKIGMIYIYTSMPWVITFSPGLSL